MTVGKLGIKNKEYSLEWEREDDEKKGLQGTQFIVSDPSFVVICNLIIN